MRLEDTYEYKKIAAILDSIQYSRANPRLNHFYHKGFLMAVLTQMARDDNQAIHYLEMAKENLLENGWRQGRGNDVIKSQTEPDE
jgi:TPR repeat protein